MKKYLTLLLIVTLSFVLIGCGKKGEASPTSTSTPESTPEEETIADGTLTCNAKVGDSFTYSKIFTFKDSAIIHATVKYIYADASKAKEGFDEYFASDTSIPDLQLNDNVISYTDSSSEGISYSALIKYNSDDTDYEWKCE